MHNKVKIGNVYGRLTVISKYTEKATQKRKWVVQCDCGETLSVRDYSLKIGETQSCGCWKSELIAESNVKRAGSRYLKEKKPIDPNWQPPQECLDEIHRRIRARKRRKALKL